MHPPFTTSTKTTDASRLLKQTFELLAKGSIKPIAPMKVFPLTEVTAGFRYMRDGKHMGKIVVSSGSSCDVQVTVSPSLYSTARLR